MYPYDNEKDPNQTLMSANPIADALANPAPPAMAPAPIAPTPPPVPVNTPKMPEYVPLEQDSLASSQSTTTTTPATQNTSTSTSQKVLPPEYYKAQENYAKATEAEKTAIGQKLGVETKMAQEELALRDAEQLRQAAALEAKKKIHTEEYDKGMSYLDSIDKKVEELKKSKYEGFWANKAAGTRIISAIAVAAGAYGAALTGSNRNYAMEIIQKEMDDDFRNYKENQEKQIQAINASKLSMEAKQKLISQKLGDMDAYELAQREQAREKIISLQPKFKGEAAQAELNSIVARLDQSIAQKDMDIREKTATVISKNIENRAAQSTTVNTSNNATTTKKVALQKDADGKLIKPLGKDEQALMDKYESDQQTKDYRAVRTAYEKVKTAGTAKDPTGADDMALVYGFMKILDPGSMVKDTEYNMAQSSGSYGENAKAFLSRYTTGEKLTPELRARFVKTAKELVGAANAGHEQTRNDYRESAKQRGLDYKNMFPTKDPILQAPQGQVSQQQAPSSPYQVGQVVDGYTFLGGDYKDQNNWRQ